MFRSVGLPAKCRQQKNARIGCLRTGYLSGRHAAIVIEEMVGVVVLDRFTTATAITLLEAAAPKLSEE